MRRLIRRLFGYETLRDRTCREVAQAMDHMLTRHHSSSTVKLTLANGNMLVVEMSAYVHKTKP